VGHEIKHDGYRLIANRGSGRVLMCSISSLNGREQRTLPLENRKARPEGLMRGSPTRIQYSDHVDGDGAEGPAHRETGAVRAIELQWADSLGPNDLRSHLAQVEQQQTRRRGLQANRAAINPNN
jgi:hypothetical protein